MRRICPRPTYQELLDALVAVAARPGLESSREPNPAMYRARGIIARCHETSGRVESMSPVPPANVVVVIKEDRLVSVLADVPVNAMLLDYRTKETDSRCVHEVSLSDVPGDSAPAVVLPLPVDVAAERVKALQSLAEASDIAAPRPF